MTEPVKQYTLEKWLNGFANGVKRKDEIPEVRAEIDQANAYVARALAADKKVSFAKSATLNWKMLDTQQKINTGFSGAFAVMAAFGALHSANHAVTHDENGKSHIQWSNVGVALLEVTIAAGLAFSAVETLRTR